MFKTPVFGFPHTIAIILAVLFLFVMKKFHDYTDQSLFKMGALSLMGAVAGILASYFLALILCSIFRGGFDFITKFWGVFIGLSVINLITGSLIGILIAQRNQSR